MADDQFLLIMCDFCALPEIIYTEHFFPLELRDNYKSSRSADKLRERLAISVKRLNTGYWPIIWIRNSFAKCQLRDEVDVP